MSDPIRIFVGTDCNNCDLESQSVLEHSIRKNASQPVDIVFMQQQKAGPWSGWRTASARTPFSHYRWSIPALCDYEGKAIYCDSDFIFVADVAELWNQDVPGVFLMKLGKKEGAKLKTCSMLFNCATAKGHVPGLDKLRQMDDAQGRMLEYFRVRRELIGPYDGDWNAVDLKGYELNDPRVKAIHYSRIETQLQLRHALPRLQREGRSHWYTGEIFPHARPELQALFDELLAEAIGAGYEPERYRIDPFGAYAKRDFKYSTHKGVA